MAVLTTKMLARASELLRRGTSYRDALALSDTVVQADLDAIPIIVTLTAAAYAALPVVNPNTLYAIIG